MILLIHILTGLVSVVAAITNMASPSKGKRNITLGATGVTVLLGAVLLIEKPSQLGRVCVTGLVLVALSVLSAVIARRKVRQFEKVSNKYD